MGKVQKKSMHQVNELKWKKTKLIFSALATDGESKRVSKFANAPDEDPKNGKY